MRITKVELEQRLTAALRENEALRLEVAQLKGTLEARARAAANGTKVRSVAVPTPSVDQLAYRVYIAGAREKAQRSGCSVKVLSFAAWLAQEREPA
jgi:hypothetical protein